MRTVRGPDGRTYLLVKRSSDASRVRDPKTGEERHFPNAELEDVGGESPLETAARAVPESARRVLVAVPTEQALGLLVELVERGPLSVVELMDAYDLCESDLHGLLTEFKIAGLIEETRVYGERGYEATAVAHEGVSHLRR
ncbi:hypothetical protein KU306_08850 [Haloferax larsenii]|uniref:Transcriptional regulator n=1 Tax=Haloferax larsenii TaxID=302484 RepID=A0ABY5R9N8_HALLR|nr:hypothetical protein [Haloferax larsenii]ELZ84125.1 hypothetical protein C455_00432 [Haloferax larsenii JCM 13917]UVE49046.1 hypothetical protein KU306_08850 [Haloferax larsenii]